MRKGLSREEEEEAWRAGDLDTLARSVMPMVRKKCAELARATGYHDLDDLYSCANLHLTRILLNFKPGRGRLTTIVGWRLKATLAQDVLKNRTDHLRIDDLSEWSLAVVDTHRDSEGEVAKLRKAIKLLGDKQRLAVESHLNGVPAASVAKKLGITTPSAWLLLARAKSRLREIIETGLVD